MGLKTRLIDVGLAPIVALAAVPMRLVRRGPVRRLPLTRSALMRAKVFPLVNHYYEPLFDTGHLDRRNGPRPLPGIDFRLEDQVALLRRFERSEVLKRVPRAEAGGDGFHMDNGTFESGDAEIWFHMITHFKPARIVEIGSGNSTRMARLAIDALAAEDPGYRCDHVCIEPYEMPWLERLPITVIRRKLEDVDPSIFATLGRGDVLFIDSSHMIRPQGEVLQEFLQILPGLAPGVIVHVHDIFSPRDYPIQWLEEPRFWNEQYLFEAFLTHNDRWDVLLAVNMLKHERYAELERVCPYLDERREPGSFYMRRR